MGSVLWACFFLCLGRGRSVTPPVPCCGSLAIFTHRDGPKRVKIMPRSGEFIEILCLICHGTGVFSFSWLECQHSAA